MSVSGGPPVAMPSPIASARMHWKLGASLPAYAQLSTSPTPSQSPITIVSDATWELSIPPVPPAKFSLHKGNWFAHLEITDEDGRVWTTHECRMEVKEDYT